MVYNTAKPAPNDDLDVSVTDIQQNFLTANTVMAVDHFPFDDVSGFQGRHKKVQLFAGVDPAPTGGEGILYCKGVLPDLEAQMFWRFAANPKILQLTRSTPSDVAGVNGVGSITRFTMLPGGYMVITGFATNAVDGSTINLSNSGIFAFTTIVSIDLTALGNSDNGTNRALVAQPRSVNTAGGTMIINLQDVNNNSQITARTVYFTVVGF